jgi:hypothetical protein
MDGAMAKARSVALRYDGFSFKVGDFYFADKHS